MIWVVVYIALAFGAYCVARVTRNAGFLFGTGWFLSSALWKFFSP